LLTICWLLLLLLLLLCWRGVWWDMLGKAVDGDEVECEDEVVCCQACAKGGGADGQRLTHSLGSGMGVDG
jgi:hypothetical protein